MILYADFDGVFTPPFKVWYIDTGFKKAKIISDRDNFALDKLNPIIISKDASVNKEWCDRRNIKFIHCPNKKYDELATYHRVKFNEDPENNYIYVGDSMFDFECLKNARVAYVPNDASKLLLRELDRVGSGYIRLDANGGEGVLEEIYMRLYNER